MEDFVDEYRYNSEFLEDPLLCGITEEGKSVALMAYICKKQAEEIKLLKDIVDRMYQGENLGADMELDSLINQL